MATQTSLLRAVQHLRNQAGDRRPDVELLECYARGGDEDAFTALVRRHGALVFGVARRQLSDLHRVEDVFQATFLALARSAGRLTREHSLTNWLYTVALRQARKAKVRDARRAAFDRERTVPESASCDPLEELSGRELVSLIDEELERLPETFRLPILLCCVEGLSREEAAERLGWSPGSVKGRLERGRRCLADRLGKKGLAPSVLFLDPFTRGVPKALVSRAVDLSASPWAATIPASIVKLAATSSWMKGTTVLALCCSLLVMGLTALFVWSGPGQPTPEQPPGQPDVVNQPDDPLPELAVRRYGSAGFRHGMQITSLAVSRDGTFALAAGGPGPWESIRRFDLRDGRRVMALPKRYYEVEAVAIAPDGKTFATKQALKLVIYDAKTGEELASLQAAQANSRGVTNWITYSPDGSMLALAPLGNEIVFVDVATREIIRKISRRYSLASGAFTPDGKHFAAGGYDHDEDRNYYIWLWEVSTGKEVRKFNNGKHGLRTLAISPDGKTLAAGGMDGRVRLWDMATGQFQHEFSDGGPQIWSMAFSPDGQTLAAAGDTIHLYDLSTRKQRLHIPRKALGLHFSPSGDALTAGVGGSIYQWSTKTGQQLTPTAIDSGIEQIELGLGGHVLITHDLAGVVSWVDPTNRISRLGFSGIPSGRDIPQTSVVHLWDRATGKLLRRMELGYQGQLAVTPDGRHLVLAVDDPKFKYTSPNQGLKLKLFDLASQTFVDRFPPIFASRAQLKAFTSDGKSLVTVDIRDSKVRLWDVATGGVRREFPAFTETEPHALYAVLACCLSPDGRTLALAYARHFPLARNDGLTLLRLWDVSTGKLLHQLEGHNNLILNLAFSPDGRYLASCEESPRDEQKPNREDAFHVWDTTTGKRITPLPHGLPSRANRIAFSPDGRTLASSSFDGSVTLWETASWTSRAKFPAHPDHVTALRYAGDGTLLTGSTDATVLAWRLRPAKPNDDNPMSQGWKTLRETDAQAAYHAQGRFFSSPREAVEFLAEHLPPATEIDAKHLAKLLADLDNEDFATREQATQALGEYGRLVEKELRETLAKTTSEEVRRRVKILLAQIAPAATPPEELRMGRAVEILEWLDTPEARELLGKLAKGKRDAVLTREARAALKRVERVGR